MFLTSPFPSVRFLPALRRTHQRTIRFPIRRKQSETHNCFNLYENQGYISSKEYTDTLRDPVYDRIQKVNKQTFSSSSITSYFTDALIEQVIQDLKAKCGYTETQAYNALYSRGLTIYSTQDKSMQKTVDSMMNNKNIILRTLGMN